MITDKARFRSHAKHPQVTRDLRLRIVSGHYQLGEQLPHRDQLEKELEASRVTVQIALNALHDDGFIRSAAGKGTFIATHPPFVTDLAIVFPIGAESFGAHRFYSALQAEAQAWATAHGGKLRTYYNFATVNSPSYPQLLDDAACHRMMGIIWAAAPFSIANSPLLTDPTFPPSIAMHSTPNVGYKGCCAYPDVDRFELQAMQLFKKNGRKRIAVIGCDPLKRNAEQDDHACA